MKLFWRLYKYDRMAKYCMKKNNYDKKNSNYKRNYSKPSTFKLWYINRKYKKLLKLLRTCDYQTYLNTDHWKWVSSERRKYSNGLCELCGAKATEVHHATYIHRGDESINELLALCHQCHMKLHNNVSASKSDAYQKKSIKAINDIRNNRLNSTKNINLLQQQIELQKNLICKQKEIIKILQESKTSKKPVN